MGSSLNGNKPFLIKTWKGIQKINPDEILFIEADLQGIKIELVNNRQCECPQRLTEIEAVLKKYHFFRVHRKYLINIFFVIEYIKNKEIIRLVDAERSVEIPVSRRNRKSFIETWKEFSMAEQEIM